MLATCCRLCIPLTYDNSFLCDMCLRERERVTKIKIHDIVHKNGRPQHPGRPSVFPKQSFRRPLMRNRCNHSRTRCSLEPGGCRRGQASEGEGLCGGDNALLLFISLFSYFHLTTWVTCSTNTVLLKAVGDGWHHRWSPSTNRTSNIERRERDRGSLLAIFVLYLLVAQAMHHLRGW